MLKIINLLIILLLCSCASNPYIDNFYPIESSTNVVTCHGRTRTNCSNIEPVLIVSDSSIKIDSGYKVVGVANFLGNYNSEYLADANLCGKYYNVDLIYLAKPKFEYQYQFTVTTMRTITQDFNVNTVGNFAGKHYYQSTNGNIETRVPETNTYTGYKYSYKSIFLKKK